MENSPLLTIPLNTKRVHGVATTRSGCEVCMPVDSFDKVSQLSKKRALQTILDNQEPDKPPTVA